MSDYDLDQASIISDLTFPLNLLLVSLVVGSTNIECCKSSLNKAVVLLLLLTPDLCHFDCLFGIVLKGKSICLLTG